MFQFENFSEYSHNEVGKVQDLTESRDIECTTKLEPLEEQLRIFEQRVLEYETVATLLEESCDKMRNGTLGLNENEDLLLQTQNNITELQNNSDAIKKDKTKVEELRYHLDCINNHVTTSKSFLLNEASSIAE